MLLAIDSSTRWMGLALYDGAQVVGEISWHTHNNHTVELSSAVDDLLTRCNVQTAEIKALAAALGPGSFTSLRIGLAVVKGMALALSVPVIGVPTLDILAAAQPVQSMPLACVLQAGRSRLALGWYETVNHRWQMKGDYRVIGVEDLAREINRPVMVCGELSTQERQYLQQECPAALLVSPAQAVRRTSFLAEMAWERWQSGWVDDVISLAPIYLHLAEPIPA